MIRFTILEVRAQHVITNLALAVVAGLPLFVFRSLGDPYQAPRALACSAALLMLLSFAARDERRVGPPWTPVLAGVLLLVSAVSALAAHPASSLWGVQGRLQGLAMLTLLMAAGVTGALIAPRQITRLAMLLSASNVVVSLIVLAEAGFGLTPVALFGNPTIGGQWLALSTSVSLAALVCMPGRHVKALAASSAVLGMAAIGASGSRAAMLAVALCLICLAPFVPRARRTPLAMGSLALVLVLVTGVSLAGSRVTEKLSLAALTGGSIASRAQIWGSTSRMIADRPLLGVGPGRFIYEFPKYQTLAQARLEGADVRADQAHSQPLQLSAENGLAAGLMWVTLAGAAVWTALKRARAGDGAGLILFGGLVAYVAQAAFGVASVEVDVLGWLLGGMALGRAGLTQGTRISPARIVGLVASGTLLLGFSWYCAANAAFARGVEEFSRGDLARSQMSLQAAVRMDPLTDIYRVAFADTGTYMSQADRSVALASIESGLRLESGSYDLALSKARLLRSMDRPAEQVADAYGDALALYPLGLTVVREAVSAFTAAGRSDEAAAASALAEDLAATGAAR